MLKIINQDAQVLRPVVKADYASEAASGEDLTFSAQQPSGDPVLKYRWNFGEGVHLEGQGVSHAWTEPGDYKVRLATNGLDHTQVNLKSDVHITGPNSTSFTAGLIRRFGPKRPNLDQLQWRLNLTRLVVLLAFLKLEPVWTLRRKPVATHVWEALRAAHIMN